VIDHRARVGRRQCVELVLAAVVPAE
jgi:hypothetical protein